eukprot:6080394-Amphidinium_carterae.1
MVSTPWSRGLPEQQVGEHRCQGCRCVCAADCTITKERQYNNDDSDVERAYLSTHKDVRLLTSSSIDSSSCELEHIGSQLISVMSLCILLKTTLLQNAAVFAFQADLHQMMTRLLDGKGL